MAIGALDVGLLVADESSFGELRLRATDALFAGGALRKAELSLVTASFVATTLDDAHIGRCEELRALSHRAITSS